jgi:hypothetical protein
MSGPPAVAHPATHGPLLSSAPGAACPQLAKADAASAAHSVVDLLRAWPGARSHSRRVFVQGRGLWIGAVFSWP